MRRLTLFLSLPALLAAAAPATRDLSLPVPGGRTLTGTLSLPEGRGKHPVVILAHPFNASRDGWAPLAEKLNARGIATLALDLPAEGADQLPAELALAAEVRTQAAGVDPGMAGETSDGEPDVLASPVDDRPEVLSVGRVDCKHGAAPASRLLGVLILRTGGFYSGHGAKFRRMVW